jgi:hypothetical protein
MILLRSQLGYLWFELIIIFDCGPAVDIVLNCIELGIYSFKLTFGLLLIVIELLNWNIEIFLV